MKFLVLVLCVATASTSVLAKEVKLTLVQANDVYEIAPVNGGRYGGLARVQSLVKQLKRENRNTYTILAGDFISPSAIGTAKVGGERLNGRQMIDVLNAMKWDYVTLGNHEFDNGRETLLARLSEAKFKTVTSNVIDRETNKPFANTILTDTFTVDGVKVGLAGITLPSLAKDFLRIEDPLSKARSTIADLKEQQGVDILILITHQDIEEDVVFAEELENVDLIIGGHEHQNIYMRRGPRLTPIAKADANARSVFIHELFYDTRTKALTVGSSLTTITGALPEDPAIKALIDSWVDVAFDAFRRDGFQPEQEITVTPEALDGLEASVRNRTTRLTEIVANSAVHAFPNAELSLVNAGSMRIDDVIPPGPVTQYDVIRVLPFGGSYEEVSVPGDILIKAFDIGQANRGTGGYLHHANVENINNSWLISGKAVDAQRNYTVSISSFLLNKGDTGLEFLVNNDRIKKLSPKSVDASRALISELENTYPIAVTNLSNQIASQPLTHSLSTEDAGAHWSVAHLSNSQISSHRLY